MILQEWPPSLIETLCFFAQRKIDRLGCRKLSSFMKNSGLGMNLHGGNEQQVLDGWMQVGAYGETSLGRQQHDICGWPIHRKIGDTGGQQQLIQERIKCEVSVRARPACNLDAFGSYEALDYGGIPARHDERGVDIAGNQFFGRYLRRKPRYFTNNAIDLGPFN